MANASTPQTPRAEHNHDADAIAQAARELLGLALLVLPALALAHAWLLPAARYSVSATHAILVVACAIARELAPRLEPANLQKMLLQMYAILFAGAFVVCVQLATSQEPTPLLSYLSAVSFFILIAASIPTMCRQVERSSDAAVAED